MPVNSISPSQPAQVTQVPKKTEAEAVRKQSDMQESNKVKDRRDVAERQAQLQKQQLQQAQESSKPAVNSSGQKIGTRINVSA